ncbi:tail fiber assembly protein [Enterobacter hormaechei subsp. xiangfangensis]|nr:tail fiber assembly protein [Enterobacter hormaechei]
MPDSPEIPKEAIEISSETYEEFAGAPWPKGKILSADAEGFPTWSDAPPLTHAELVEAAKVQKQMLIDQANEYMNSKQWPGKAAIGRLKGDELVSYNLWLDYLDTLDVIKTDLAPNISWPEPPKD